MRLCGEKEQMAKVFTQREREKQEIKASDEVIGFNPSPSPSAAH
jgi:hypothetical protein